MKTDQEFTSVNFSLPRAQRDWLEARIASSGFGTVSEYLRELIRRDQRDAARDELEHKLLKALDSGDAIEVTPEFWERKRRELIARHGPAKRPTEE